MPALREVFAEYSIRFDPQKNLAKGSKESKELKALLQQLTAVLRQLTGALGGASKPAKDLASGMDTAGRRASRLRRILVSLREQVRGLTGVFGKLAAAIGGAIMVRAMTRFILDTIKIGDALDKVSQQLGFTVRELQALQHAAQLGGVDNAAFAQSMRQLQANAAAAAHTGGDIADSFRRIGVEVRGSNGELKSGNDLLIEVARGLDDTVNSTERVALAQRLMGESGARMIPMFAAIRDGTSEIEAEIDRLGGGMSALAIQRSVELTDSITRLRLSFTSFRSVVATRILPTIDQAVQYFTRFSVWLGNVADKSRIVESAIISISIAIGLATAAIIVFTVVGAAVFAAVAAFTALALIIDDVWVGLEGGQSVTRNLLTALGDLVGVANLGTIVFEDLTGWILHVTSATIAFGLAAATGADQTVSAWNQVIRTIQLVAREMARVNALVAGFFGSETVPDFIRNARFAGGSERTEAARSRGQRIRENLGLGALGRGALDRLGQAATVPFLSPARRPGLTQTVDAPLTVGNITINEAENPDATRRVVQDELRSAQQRQIRQIQASGLVGQTASEGAAS
jgi:hypothetical protein